MKQLTQSFSYKALVTFVMLTLMQVIAFAQDPAGSTGTSGGASTNSSSSSTTTTTTTETWYTEPWVWIVGGAVLLLLIVALTRGNRDTATRSDKVTVTKSVKTDTDV
jgi:glucan phosphoethanolaminetransferase (alkaline phosphatase superfamily)